MLETKRLTFLSKVLFFHVDKTGGNRNTLSQETVSFLVVVVQHLERLEPKQQVARVEEHLVVGGCDGVGDLPGSFNLPECHESRVVGDGIANQLCTLCLSLFRYQTQRRINQRFNQVL